MTDDNTLDGIEDKVLHLLERRRYQQAENLIANALKGNPNNIVLLFYSALIYYETEQYDKSERTLGEIFAFDPQNEDARFLLASVYKELQSYSDAELLIIELIRDNPDSSRYYTLYANVMLETLHIDKADRLAREAIRLDPDDMSAQIVYVICEVVNNNKPEYQQRLFELVRSYPEAQASAAMILIVLYEQKKYSEALRIAQELLRGDPQNEMVVNMIKELRVLTHWTMLPLFPSLKYGWHASAVLWFVAIIAFQLSSHFSSQMATLALVYGWLAYVLYSWIYPPFLRKVLN